MDNKLDVEKKHILDNWDLLSEDTKSMLKIIGVAPYIKNGKKIN